MKVAALSDIDEVDFRKGSGLVPVIAQHYATGEVLMVAWADAEAVRQTLTTGEMHFHSRSRDELWRKGATSGNVLRLIELEADCDRDTLLARVDPAGPACHTNEGNCFSARPTLAALAATIDARADASTDTPSDGYTARLLHDRNLRLKKLGEEAAELAVAGADDDPARVTSEAADLLYHLLVVARASDVSLAAILRELDRRRAKP